ncbi:hypothetical protein RhiirA4_427586, partial [Rhizophagus irregularis]
IDYVVNRPFSTDPNQIANHHPYYKEYHSLRFDAKKRIKNWLQYVQKRNKKKKQLPPLPPGHQGDQRIYYKDTYNINLFDYKRNRNILTNNNDLFFWRTPPPDTDLTTTMSDISYTSATEWLTSVEAPPMPKHD